MTRRLCLADEETEELYLVDFAQKIIDKQREVQTLSHKEQKADDGEEDTRAPDLPVPGPKDPEEEW